MWQGGGVSESSVEAFFEVSAGERTVPGIWHETYWLRRHEVAYAWVARHLSTRSSAPLVLDAGCGEGFGPAALQAAGARVVALDYDAAATSHGASTYVSLTLVRGNLVALPLASGCADVLVSLQTVEHVWDQTRFVTECARVLATGGQVVLSTPNRLTFPPGNPYHHRELDAVELAEALSASFIDVRVRGVHHGPRLVAWERDHGDLVDHQLAIDPMRWPAEVAAMVRSVSIDDFVITDDPTGSRDLIATAVAP